MPSNPGEYVEIDEVEWRRRVGSTIVELDARLARVEPVVAVIDSRTARQEAKLDLVLRPHSPGFVRAVAVIGVGALLVIASALTYAALRPSAAADAAVRMARVQ